MQHPETWFVKFARKKYNPPTRGTSFNMGLYRKMHLKDSPKPLN